MPPVVIQILGILGMIMALISFQQKTQKGIVLMQLCCSAFFAIHFILLGAVTGGILNVMAVIRAIVYSQKGKKWADHIAWPILFCILSLVIYALTFICFGVEPSLKNFLLELLPALGIISTTIAFRMERAKDVRLLSMINSPLWLIYNSINFSIGGILTECFSLISIIIGILRLDIKRKK